MFFKTFCLFFFNVSHINCFMLLIFFQFILYTDQSFSGILSVVVTILGRRYSHFLLKYFTESKGITIATGNCNLLHRQICKCELLLSSGNSKFRQKFFRRDSKTVHKYCNEIIEKKFSQQNKVLGNIEKFAENQGLQTFFFKEKVS